MGVVSTMDEKFDPVSAELDQLTDEEIEARLAAAIWVNEKRAFVLRYLEQETETEESSAFRGVRDRAWR